VTASLETFWVLLCGNKCGQTARAYFSIPDSTLDRFAVQLMSAFYMMTVWERSDEFPCDEERKFAVGFYVSSNEIGCLHVSSCYRIVIHCLFEGLTGHRCECFTKKEKSDGSYLIELVTTHPYAFILWL
jgi:hypothetical protein